MKQIYLYGLAGADASYRVVKYSRIDEEESISVITSIIDNAVWLKLKNPTIEHVYAVDDRKGLVWDYRDAIQKNTFEGFVIFKNILEKEGLMII